jgi:hypothetical protein
MALWDDAALIGRAEDEFPSLPPLLQEFFRDRAFSVLQLRSLAAGRFSLGYDRTYLRAARAVVYLTHVRGHHLR